MVKIGVIGAGSWGTALAILLSGKGHRVTLWDIDSAHIAKLEAERRNERYLPGVPFDENLRLTGTIREALFEADVALFSAPAQRFRNALEGALPHLKKDAVLVNAAKGIEQKTLARLSEIASEIAPGPRYVALSGPSHAEEVGRRMPTTVAAASEDAAAAEWIQEIFMTDRFRVYANHDVTGVELGGALKNVIALGAGISDGMGYGDNAKAAMMTRGLAEITRLGVRLGADERTFSGLTGLGDLIVTCASVHSRNRRCGVLIGEGMKPEEATAKVGMVVEGMFTAEAACELARKTGVEMPITESVRAVIHGKISAKDAVDNLMRRDKKHETT